MFQKALQVRGKVCMSDFGLTCPFNNEDLGWPEWMCYSDYTTKASVATSVICHCQVGRYAADLSPRAHSCCTPAPVWKGVIHDLHVGTGHRVMESFWMWKMSSTLLFNEAIMCFLPTVSSSAHTGSCCQALLRVGRLHTCSTSIEDNETKRYCSCKVIPGYLLFAQWASHRGNLNLH